MSPRRGDARVGTSGYQYDDWKGRFYPDDLPKTRWFEHFASEFNTVEINNTFYNLPKASTFESWHDRAPPHFCYALKLSRYGTHNKKLNDPTQWLPTFLERAEQLKSYLGPILVQLPPRWSVDVDRLAAFLDAAPRRHRWAVEFRDEGWLIDEVYDVLRRHNAAVCVHDLIDDHPWVLTADWVYVRFHGTVGGSDKYSGNYSPQKLTATARRLKRYLDRGRDVYAYFNNDVKARAVHNARDLRRYLTP